MSTKRGKMFVFLNNKKRKKEYFKSLIIGQTQSEYEERSK